MTPFEAIMTIEGTDNASDEEQLAAWQHLINTGIVWTLQGWYGRGAVHLLNAGFCTMPEESHESG